MNNTFYRLPEQHTIREWGAKVPHGFLFAVKANRYITHMKNLLHSEEPVQNLLERTEVLEDKLGPILFQLPPGWNVNAERLRNFVEVLPGGYRWAFEFRNPTWYNDQVCSILRQSGSAFCIHDHHDAPSPEWITSGFGYVRFHGAYPGGRYSPEAMISWANKLLEWERQGIDMYCYFNNDWHGYALENASELEALLAKKVGGPCEEQTLEHLCTGANDVRKNSRDR